MQSFVQWVADQVEFFPLLLLPEAKCAQSNHLPKFGDVNEGHTQRHKETDTQRESANPKP